VIDEKYNLPLTTADAMIINQADEGGPALLRRDVPGRGVTLRACKVLGYSAARHCPGIGSSSRNGPGVGQGWGLCVLRHELALQS